ncbi:MAG: hypothetical protein M0P19_11170 [Nevskia sp.]|jgi:hypothetical protein|nr:hypothetical protein [Nevskia sp.]MCK9385066.1 hypothetical protein [Nevskia sp.]
MSAIKPVTPAQFQLLAPLPLPLRGYLESAFAIIAKAGDDEDTLWALSERGEQMEMAGRLISGLANRELSTRVDTLRLANELRSRGKNRANFYFSISVLEAFEALPNRESVEALAQLGYTKARSALSWSPDERIAFTQGESVRGITIDEAVEMPTREFERLSKNLESDARLNRLQSDKARLEAELNTLREQFKKTRALQAVEDLPLFAREVREEAMVLSEQMMLAVELLEDAANRNLLGEVDHPERMRWQPAAARTLVHALGAPLARGAALIRLLKVSFGEEIAGALDADSILEASEAALFLSSRERLATRAQIERDERATERHNATPSRRGRPRGTGKGA